MEWIFYFPSLDVTLGKSESSLAFLPLFKEIYFKKYPVIMFVFILWVLYFRNTFCPYVVSFLSAAIVYYFICNHVISPLLPLAFTWEGLFNFVILIRFAAASVLFLVVLIISSVITLFWCSVSSFPSAITPLILLCVFDILSSTHLTNGIHVIVKLSYSLKLLQGIFSYSWGTFPAT